MKETCKECKYYGAAKVRDGGLETIVDNWCRMKGNIAPKNPCKWWRPKTRKEVQK
jgi:hypothetical protein